MSIDGKGALESQSRDTEKTSECMLSGMGTKPGTVLNELWMIRETRCFDMLSGHIGREDFVIICGQFSETHTGI